MLLFAIQRAFTLVPGCAAKYTCPDPSDTDRHHCSGRVRVRAIVQRSIHLALWKFNLNQGYEAKTHLLTFLGNIFGIGCFFCASGSCGLVDSVSTAEKYCFLCGGVYHSIVWDTSVDGQSTRSGKRVALNPLTLSDKASGWEGFTEQQSLSALVSYSSSFIWC